MLCKAMQAGPNKFLKTIRRRAKNAEGEMDKKFELPTWLIAMELLVNWLKQAVVLTDPRYDATRLDVCHICESAQDGGIEFQKALRVVLGAEKFNSFYNRVAETSGYSWASSLKAEVGKEDISGRCWKTDVVIRALVETVLEK